ncbi:MAG: DUF5004 domain-containing protein [Bacteroidota bacterium]
MTFLKKHLYKTNIIITLLSLIMFSCSHENTIFGIWKPVSIVLPENIQQDPIKAKTAVTTFEQSKDMFYNFHADSTFTLETEVDVPGLKNLVGSFSVIGKKIVINFNTAKLESEIDQLTDSTMNVRSDDNTIIVFKKIRDN